MKRFGKKACLLLFPLLLLMLVKGAGRAEAVRELHTTTVMVYMCGSDLESRFGSASRDLSEMLASGFDTEHTNVVVMAGGSKNWKLGFDAERTAIAEVGNRGLRTVWRSEEPMNMADSSTLSTFLRYVYDNYESERYGLILWDHGGGPNEGLCYDELFEGEFLSLPDLRDALSDSNVSKWNNKLNWVGFDACLMANVETGYYLREFTRYMIASQAQEPSSGWDYSFLKGLETDADETATARRIIDAYFSNNPNSADAVTLSCVDLSRIWEVSNAMDKFFESLYPTLSDETYSELSRERHQTRGFGRAEYNNAADYDLVDLMALTEAYENEEISGTDLKEAISNAVVYSRSNTEGIHGLSIYHPCYNREVYTSEWSSIYQNRFAPMSRGYTQYVKRFGNILTGKQLGNWGGLETQRTEGENGEIRFSLTLTEEQAANFEHATLMIIKQVYTSNGGLDNSYYEAWETPYLELDENRTLTAAYPNRAIYVVDDETGEKLGGPVNYRITQDGKLLIVIIYHDENGILDDEKINAMYYCDYSEETGEITVDYICVRDELTGEYSSRMTLDDEFFRNSDYTGAMFYILEREIAKKGDELLGFHEWPSGDSFVYFPINLPCNWHFEAFEDEDELETAFASFQITDTQNLTHSSSLCPVFPDLVQSFELVEVRDGSYDPMTIEASAQYFSREDSVNASIRFVNAPPQVRYYSTGPVHLNDTILLDNLTGFSSDGTLMLTFKRESTIGLTEIRSIDFDLTTELSDYSNYETMHIRLEFPEPVPLDHADAVPLAEGESDDGLKWRLWNVEQKDDGGISVQYDVYNGLRKTMEIDFDEIGLEGFVSNAFAMLDIAPKETAVDSVTLYPKTSAVDSDYTVVATVNEPMAAIGIKSIGTVRFYYADDSVYPTIPHEIGFELAEPIPYRQTLAAAPLLDQELVHTGDARIHLAHCQLFHDSKYDRDALCFALWVYNDTEENHNYLFEGFGVDGIRVRNETWSKIVDYDIPAHSVRFFFLQVELPDGVKVPTELSFGVFADEKYLQEAHADLTGLLG